MGTPSLFLYFRENAPAIAGKRKAPAAAQGIEAEILLPQAKDWSG
jgi:hypothetical protein